MASRSEQWEASQRAPKAPSARASSAPADMRELRFRAVRPNRSIACHLNVILQPERERASIASGAKIDAAVFKRICAREPLGFGPVLALGFAATRRRWRGRRTCNARS